MAKPLVMELLNPIIRLAMAFSLLGLKHDVEVENGECFNVSFPNFIELMGEIGIEMELK